MQFRVLLSSHDFAVIKVHQCVCVCVCILCIPGSSRISVLYDSLHSQGYSAAVLLVDSFVSPEICRAYHVRNSRAVVVYVLSQWLSRLHSGLCTRVSLLSHTFMLSFVNNACWFMPLMQKNSFSLFFRFHPPDPCYKLDYHEEDGKYSFRFTDDATNVNTANNITFDMLTTKNKTKVPIVVFTYPKAKYTILYSHGNATDCGAMFQMYALLSTYLKVNVVGYDYTGYGASMEFGIKPTEHQSYQDIDTVFTYIMTSKLVTDPAKELILYGQSIGSGPTCYLAKHRPIAGLVLHSPIMSGLRVLTDSRTLACFDIFPNIRRIAHVNVPLFVIHGQVSVIVCVLGRILCGLVV